MKTSSKLIALLFVMSLVTYVSAQNLDNSSSSVTKEASLKSDTVEAVEATGISLSWCGTGPYGQVDGSVYGGTAPYRWYQGGTLLMTTYSSSVTLNFGCNGGVLTVKDANNNEDADIVPQGCVDHGCN
ncbi:hypothetical protein [Flagellimonas olearia]|uniref:Ig-like domain-containing protein n=1 Tax=Flagellimonas olearia TaxID=552546 RepID=A0A444VJJ3_9FLAO|nr:hypothetical protein [Allomuricauda olearia]RYC50900.1 hypothetical protein DN53_17465 [Allomuricauda olearia]